MKQAAQIANTILDQLGGGGRLNAMIGARDFVATGRGVQFRIGGGATKRISRINIELNELDTYDVKFGKVRKIKGVPTYEEVQRANGIYCDMLVDLVERTTGLYLSL